MFSKQAAVKKVGAREGFRWRGEEVSRLEGLSDAVFAFAVTLLIVSTEVPKTYNDLVVKLRDFVPFAMCFVQLMAVWASTVSISSSVRPSGYDDDRFDDGFALCYFILYISIEIRFHGDVDRPHWAGYVWYV